MESDKIALEVIDLNDSARRITTMLNDYVVKTKVYDRAALKKMRRFIARAKKEIIKGQAESLKTKFVLGFVDYKRPSDPGDSMDQAIERKMKYFEELLKDIEYTLICMGGGQAFTTPEEKQIIASTMEFFDFVFERSGLWLENNIQWTAV